MAEKKRRRGYLADFRQTVGGEYIYTGASWRPEGGEKALRALRPRLGAAAGLAAAALFAAGFLPAPGSTDRFYVILPYLAALTAAFVCAWKSIRLLTGGAALRAYVYEATVPKLPGWALAGAIACGVTLLAETVHLCVRGFDGRAAAALGLLALLAAAAAGFLLLRRALRQIRWKEEK